MVDYRKTRIEDLDRVSELASKAFLDCPLFALALENSFNSREEYYVFLEKVFRVHILSYLKQDTGWVGVEDNKIVSMALFVSPDTKEVGILDYVKSGAVKLLPYFWPKRVLSLISKMDEGTKKCHQIKDNKTWHLEMIAVDTENQGQGLGRHMMENCLLPLAEKDSASQITLVTNEKRNCPFYESFGFEEFDHEELSMRYGQVENWSFVKKYK